MMQTNSKISLSPTLLEAKKNTNTHSRTGNLNCTLQPNRVSQHQEVPAVDKKR
jgi:hypothetical protein